MDILTILCVCVCGTETLTDILVMPEVAIALAAYCCCKYNAYILQFSPLLLITTLSISAYKDNKRLNNMVTWTQMYMRWEDWGYPLWSP